MPYDIPFTVGCFPLAAYLRLIDWGYLFSSKSPASCDLIEDVILEILSRLPVKSLVRFKLVCKQWYAIIESQSFIDQHFGQMSNKERLLVYYYKLNESRRAYALFVDDKCSGYEEPAHLQMPNMMIDELLGPVNGVFCLVGRSGKLILLNPATRQLKSLPKPPEVIVEPHLVLIHKVVGFGLVPFCGDYKVVSILYFLDKRVNVTNCNNPVVFVYSLGSDSWRKLKDVGCFKSGYMATRPLSKTYLNGVYYWTTGEIYIIKNVLAFDMTNEKFQEIQVPDCHYNKRKLGHLTIHGDSIALLSYGLTGCEVWAMEKAGSWNRVAVVGPYDAVSMPLCLWKNNELVIQINPSLVMLYNIRTKKRQLTRTRKGENTFNLSMVFSYKESLVSIKGKRDNCMLRDASSDILTSAWANED